MNENPFCEETQSGQRRTVDSFVAPMGPSRADNFYETIIWQAIHYSNDAVRLLQESRCEEALIHFELALTALSLPRAVIPESLPVYSGQPPCFFSAQPLIYSSIDVCCCDNSRLQGQSRNDIDEPFVRRTNVDSEDIESADEVATNASPVYTSASRSSRSNSEIFDITSSTSPSNLFAIYNRAFFFSDSAAGVFINHCTNYACRTQCLLYIEAIVLYNIGLAYHRKALQEGKTDLFERAIIFYRSSYLNLDSMIRANSFIHQVGSGCNMLVSVSSSISKLNIIFLALYNNLGHLFRHFFNQSAATICLEKVSLMLQDSDIKRGLTKDEYLLFSLNFVLHALNQHTPTAAAA